MTLFADLPAFTVPLRPDEMRLLAYLPDYDVGQSVTEVDDVDRAACSRLERRGLVAVRRWRIGDWSTVHAGWRSSAHIGEASAPPRAS